MLKTISNFFCPNVHDDDIYLWAIVQFTQVEGVIVLVNCSDNNF